MLKNSKSISAFAVVAALLLSISAPAFSAPPVRLSCALGGRCAVGDIGPGGGTVYYFNRKGFTCGLTLVVTCKYLEAAPTSVTVVWTDATYVWSDITNSVIGPLFTAIGSGFKNSHAIRNSGATLGAAFAATDYRGPNTLIDWYLPSKDELNLLYQWKTKSRVPVLGFVDNTYWSSSEYVALLAWGQYFDDGTQSNPNKNATFYVRPVRAF